MTNSDTGLPENLPGFDDPIGLLRACHKNMQDHCELLAALLDKASLDDEAIESLKERLDLKRKSVAPDKK